MARIGTTSKRLNHHVRKDGTKSVLIVYRDIIGGKYTLNTKVAVHPDNWDKKNQRVINDPDGLLTDKIDQAYLDITEASLKLRYDKKAATAENIRQYIEGIPDTSTNNLVEAFRLYCRRAERADRNVNLVRMRRSVYKVLKKYEHIHGVITFDDINRAFVDRFVEGLLKGFLSITGRRLTNNTIRTYLRVLAAFMKEAHIDNIHNNMWCLNIVAYFNRNYKVKTKERPILDSDELQKLWELEIEDEQLRAERDMFVFMCRTGLRHSDACKLKWSHIHDRGDYKCISGNDIKKGRKRSVDIKLHPTALQILESREKNDAYIFPRVGQDSSESCGRVKEIAKMAGLDRMYHTSYTTGQRLVKVEEPLYECIDTHTARHTFACWYIENGGDLYYLSSLMGHASPETTRRQYLKAVKHHLAAKHETVLTGRTGF